MKVYAVVWSSYDEFSVVGIFSTLEKAQDFKGCDVNDDLDIIDYNLDEMKRPEGCFVFRVMMAEDGELLRNYPVEKQCPTALGQGRYYDSNSYVKKSFRSYFLWAKDAENAVELADKDRLERLENNTWNK